MRKILFLFTVIAGAGIGSLTVPTEAQAQCSHLGSSGACPVGIPNGSTSSVINANGTITWNNGGISGPCCAAPAGTETGAGLLNLNNQLGGSGFHFGPVVTSVDTAPGTAPADTTGPNTGLAGIDRSNDVYVTGRGFEDYPCIGGQCTDGPGAALFGAGPNGGYQCDSGGPGCGNDLWNSPPQTGFGECGAGGCGGATVVAPLNPGIPPLGPYTRNSTFGNVDPFGGGPNVFVDPDTGQAITLDDDPAKWPERARHAAELNDAYINGRISFYPFGEPGWATKSVEDFRNTTPPPANTQAGSRFDAPTSFSSADGISNSGSASNPPLETGPYVGIGTDGNIAPPATSTQEPTSPNDKRRRFGIGTDTSVGMRTGGNPAQYFGIQTIFSHNLTSGRDTDNSDLTTYVSGVVATMSGGGPATPGGGPQTGGANGQPGIADTLVENVPVEFRAPVVSEGTRKDGSKVITVNIPGSPGPEFFDRRGAEVMVEALRAGKEYMEAYNAGRDVDDKIRQEASERRETANATGISTTPDGLASASAPGARPQQIVPRPARPAGDSVDFMEQAAFKGSVYRLEIIRTPDGRTLAVGTGEHAGHVFGETKNGAFGWRREGPWTPPPAPAPFIGSQRPAIIVKPSDTGGVVKSTLPGTVEPGDKVTVLEIGRTPGPEANENFRIRVQIANSDRDQMIKSLFQDGFESGNTSAWSSTNR